MQNVLFKVSSVFPSFDGETNAFAGAGEATVFVRFAGCPLACNWCDTEYAKSPSQAKFKPSATELLTIVESFGAAESKVTLTGGEPLAQFGLNDLLKLLCGLRVTVETSGAYSLTKFPDIDGVRQHEYIADPDIRFVMDYKLPSSGMVERMLSQFLVVYGFRPTVDIVKFVVADRDDFDFAKRILSMNMEQAVPARAFYFSPVHSKLKPAQLFDWVLDELPSGVGLSAQLHKVLKWPESK